MIDIEQINMRLPTGYEHHAQSVADRVANLLALRNHSGFTDVQTLKIPTIYINADASVNDIAALITDGICSSFGDKK